MAQDFHAAFALGTDDKHIAAVDANGVALAAIQGFNRKLEKENVKLKAENATIKARLTALEKQTANHTRTQARLAALESRFERMFQARGVGEESGKRRTEEAETGEKGVPDSSSAITWADDSRPQPRWHGIVLGVQHSARARQLSPVPSQSGQTSGCLLRSSQNVRSIGPYAD